LPGPGGGGGGGGASGGGSDNGASGGGGGLTPVPWVNEWTLSLVARLTPQQLCDTCTGAALAALGLYYASGGNEFLWESYKALAEERDFWCEVARELEE
jgi:hypothetical protein